ncbi:gamma-glutamyl-gamma-aminobutyrate hydrolase family protein [uncultured Legionella sp.]|uniref:gamma-glutamyl-gamma-aminobutyrate hydrolase family protein n=1 Tax=uncultured Legionella sp. TaxID=210934 RepID=UPI00261DC882|nr:gamma-glutamyl-gamma-aminobutyrate hydrolase family protein [uncultured Legionella sp.]
MPIAAVTYSSKVGGSSVVSLKESFVDVGCTVVDADYREMMADISEPKFDELYTSSQGRLKLFAHAKAKAMTMLENVDCLALPGNNAMIDPELFNQERDPTQTYDFSRTIVELALVHVAVEKGMPILGACGGHQVVAVYGGGEITDLNINQLTQQSYMNYDAIRINKDTMLAKIIASHLDLVVNIEEIEIKTEEENTKEIIDKSYYEGQFFGAHSQRISKLPKGFIASSIASDGDTIESMESLVGTPILTTQFHPEIGANGLPESKFIYQKDQHNIDMNLKIFDFMSKAAQTYNQKKSVVSELKQFKPADGANIKPSDVKAFFGQQRFKLNNNDVAISAEEPEKTSYSWLGRLGLSVGLGLLATAGVIAFAPLAVLGSIGLLGVVALGGVVGLLTAGVMYPVSEFLSQSVSYLQKEIGLWISSNMRDSAAKLMTTFLVSQLQEKENAKVGKVKELTEQSPDEAGTKYGAFFDKGKDALNPPPNELLRDTPAQLWSDQVDSEHASITIDNPNNSTDAEAPPMTP